MLIDNQFPLGARVLIERRGPGTVLEVLPKATDCYGAQRHPYRIKLDEGGEFIAHPFSMKRVVRPDSVTDMVQCPECWRLVRVEELTDVLALGNYGSYRRCTRCAAHDAELLSIEEA